MSASDLHDFWAWWLGHKDRLDEAIWAGTFDEQIDEITTALGKVDERLGWELAPGEESRNQLIITAGGDPEVRPLARRLLAAAPDADEAWSYSDMRPPRSLDSGLLIGESELVYGDATFIFKPNTHSMDITIHHPLLASLPASDQVQISFMILDAAIGERATELWIDAVDNSPRPLPNAHHISELPAIVSQLEGHVLEDGDMSWVVLEARGADHPMFARKLARLRSVLNPNFDTHVAVEVPYRGNEHGLPTESAMHDLEKFEKTLDKGMGSDGRLVVVETGGGRRTFHLYVDSTTAALGSIEHAAAEWKHGDANINYESDPGWHAVRHFG